MGPGPQLSACQPYDALVSTPKGMIAIGQLVESRAIGQTVYDADGTTKIQAVKDNGQKPVRRVVLRNGNYIEANPDQVVRAERQRRPEPEWLAVNDLYLGLRIHQLPPSLRVA